MSEKDNAQNVIDSYRKRQNMAQKAPVYFVFAAILLVVGAAFVIYWFASPTLPTFSFMATETATPTNTATVTPSLTPTNTPTETPTPEPPTETPTPMPTATAAGPFIYIVQEGDTLFGIAEAFGVDLLTLMALNPNIDPANPVIHVSDEIIIPAPDTTLPTATSIAADYRGTIDYQVAVGDSLESIASRFNSTVDAIMNANKEDLTNQNDIFVGQIIKVPVNIATPAPTRTPGLATTFPLTQAATQNP